MMRAISIWVLVVAPVASAAWAAPDGGVAPGKGPDPVVERAQALKEAGELLEKAGAARTRGNRNFAEQLFSSAELIVGPEGVAVSRERRSSWRWSPLIPSRTRRGAS